MLLRLSKGTTLTLVEGREILFSVRTGESFGLNETAARMLKSSFESEPEQVALQLAAEYGVSAAEIREDLDQLIGSLSRAKLIELVSPC
jgi:hypothetical protein